MKNVFKFLVAGILLISTCSFQTQSDTSLARVNKVNGRLVFYHSEPINNYDVIFTFKDLIPNYDCNTIEENMNGAIKNANIEAGQQGKIYDAIIVTKGERDIAVTFTDKSKDNTIARVKREGGVLVFMGCEPLAGYTTITKLDASGHGMRVATGKCPSWQEQIEKILKKIDKMKIDKKKIDCDAVLLGDTKYDFLIKFK